MQQRRRDEDLLAHPLRERGKLRVAVVLEPEDLEQAVDFLRKGTARNAPQLADEREVLGPVRYVYKCASSGT